MIIPKYFGFNAPFLQRNSGLAAGFVNVLPRQVDDRLIKNDLLQLLLTSPGERMMRPTFGSAIRRYLFEPMTDNSLALLRDNIQEVVSQYERRVTLTEVTTEVSGNTLNIKVFGFLNLDRFERRSNSKNADLLIELNLPTKATV